jgi:hypothetical protein
MTRTGQANWEIPLASKSISINSFNNKALTAIVIPINKGKYALFIAYNLPPKNPPASPPTAAPAPNTAIREVASCQIWNDFDNYISLKLIVTSKTTIFKFDRRY